MTRNDALTAEPPKRKDLLTNTRVRAWHEARALKSRLSADVDLRKLGLLLERIKLDPESVVLLATKDPDHLQDALIRYATNLKRAGCVDEYVTKTLSGLKSYLRFRRVRFDGYPTLSPIRGSTLSNERVPTPEELGHVLDVLSVRGRTIALFVAHTGVRFQVLGDYTGERGLTIGDLPDLELEPELRFKETPFVVRVPADLSKTRVSYVTFGSSQLASVFLSYLAGRSMQGEKLDKRSPVIAPTPAANLRGATRTSRVAVSKRRRFIVTGALVRELAGSLHGSAPKGVRWRPYVLRAYCSTRLLMAEGAGKITRDLREAILGHYGGVSARYNVGKTWGEDLLKEARAAYSRCEPFLSTIPTRSAEDTQASIAKVMLLGLGYTEKGLADKDLLDPQVFQELVREKMVKAQPIQKQKLVEAEALPQYLEEGWTVVTAVNGHQVVLNPPG